MTSKAESGKTIPGGGLEWFEVNLDTCDAYPDTKDEYFGISGLFPAASYEEAIQLILRKFIRYLEKRQHKECESWIANIIKDHGSVYTWIAKGVKTPRPELSLSEWKVDVGCCDTSLLEP